MNTLNSQFVPAQLKAEILSEALPFIQKFHGKTIVIKYGGNAMTENKANSFRACASLMQKPWKSWNGS